MNSSQIDSTFLWFSNNANTGRMDLIFYAFQQKMLTHLTNRIL